MCMDVFDADSNPMGREGYGYLSGRLSTIHCDEEFKESEQLDTVPS